jgi:hypothetical protein
MIKKYTRFDGNNLEGLGSILQSQLHLYAYCRMNGFKPNMVKLINISHYQYTNQSYEIYNKKINDFFSFFDSDNSDGDYIDPNWLIRVWGEQFNHEKKYYINELSDKIIYSDEFYFDRNKTTLTLHIRSFNTEDVCHDRNREYYDKNKEKYYYNLIQNLKKIHGENLDIHLFSQGDEENFRIFKDIFDCKLHINVDIIKTFYHLMMSDILITSNSSFSWCPHLFGINKHVYSRDNFFHSWYPNVKKVDLFGNIMN